MGNHKGNNFTIIIRDIKKISQNNNNQKDICVCNGNNENILQNIKNFKEKGFLNYYGLQRFGTYRCPSHYLGKLLVENNIKELVRKYLSPNNEMTDEKYNEALRLFAETNNAKDSLSVYQMLYEVYIICIDITR